MPNLLDAAYAVSVWPHFCWHRFVTGKYGPAVMEKTGRVPDRFKASATAVMGVEDTHYEPPCLWLHAVSVGEVAASVDLAKAFMRDNPRWELRVSTTTATGRKVAEKHFGEGTVFYYPLDFSWMVERAFAHIRPSLVLLMELEIWPNFLDAARCHSVPVVVANARITERSVKRFAYVPALARKMGNGVESWFAQTDEYAKRLEAIGVPANHIEVLGSVKYDAVPLDVDERVGKFYRRLFGCGEEFHPAGGPPLVVAGSTHAGEERKVLEACGEAVAKGAPKPRVVLVPRHPERLREVETIAAEFGSCVLRSKLPEPLPGGDAAGPAASADIVIVDTMGELSKIYGAGDIVFVGGTLAPIGGHNMMEPCGLARPTVVGPSLANFSEPAELLAKADGLAVVQDAAGLARVFGEWLTDPRRAADMGERARAALLKQRGAVKRMVDRLNVIARGVAAKK